MARKIVHARSMREEGIAKAITFTTHRKTQDLTHRHACGASNCTMPASVASIGALAKGRSGRTNRVAQQSNRRRNMLIAFICIRDGGGSVILAVLWATGINHRGQLS